MATYIQAGDAIDYTPSAAVTAGDVIVLGLLVCVANHDIAADTLGAITTTGVFSFAKATGTGEGLAVGVKAYWNATSEEMSETDTDVYAGKTIAAAGDDDTTVLVKLSNE